MKKNLDVGKNINIESRSLSNESVESRLSSMANNNANSVEQQDTLPVPVTNSEETEEVEEDENEENNARLRFESPDSSGSIICLDDSLPESSAPTSNNSNKSKQQETNFFRLGPPPPNSGGEDRQSTTQGEESSAIATTNGQKTNVEKANVEQQQRGAGLGESTTSRLVMTNNKNSSIASPTILSNNNSFTNFYTSAMKSPVVAISRNNTSIDGGGSTSTLPNSIPILDYAPMTSGHSWQMQRSMFGNINNGSTNNAASTLLTNSNSPTTFRPLINDVSNKQVAQQLSSFLYGIYKKNMGYPTNPI